MIQAMILEVKFIVKFRYVDCRLRWKSPFRTVRFGQMFLIRHYDNGIFLEVYGIGSGFMIIHRKKSKKVVFSKHNVDNNGCRLYCRFLDDRVVEGL
jgi:hypothetical protein